MHPLALRDGGNHLPESPDSQPRYRWIEVGSDAPREVRQLSPVLTEAVALSASRRDQPVVIVRQHDPYILLGPQDRRLPHVDRIVSWGAQRGLPVFMRIGGGSLVIQDAGTISFGAARPCRDFTTLERNFRELGLGAIRALGLLGIAADFGRAVGSYCEGPWDLVVDGVKVAGVAQAIRRGFALVSGMILVSQDPDLTTRRVEGLYRLGGGPRALDPGAVTSLARLLGRPVSLDEVARALYRGFSSTFTLEPSALSGDEEEEARILYTERRLLGPGAPGRGAAAP